MSQINSEDNTAAKNHKAMADSSNCRFCKFPLSIQLVDLGMSPLSNAFLKNEELNRMEQFYPLKVFVCENCLLVQLNEYESPEKIFSDYVYFSSFSNSWLEHSKSYCDMICSRLGINKNSFVVELASNDGYLLQYFLDKGIPCLGIEPAENVARVAIQKGIPTISEFFGTRLASRLTNKYDNADLIIANNVLAHVPDINDFVEGIRQILDKDGVATFEFPHLYNMIQLHEFDTIYHEHFSYLSLLAVENIFSAHGLKIIDLDELPTHGGSLRLYAVHDSNKLEAKKRVNEFRKKEISGGLSELSTYLHFSESVKKQKRNLLSVLNDLKNRNKKIVGYGAAAKGNTLFNFCGIRTDYIDYVVDRNPAKQNKFLPGSHIPVYNPEKILDEKPDYMFIIPWNLKEEIIEQNSYIRNWGGKFIVPIPEVEIIE